MDFSVILNWILGGGLVTALISIITLKATVREANAKADEARANAEKALAETETVRIDNAEHATRILIENIVEPLKEELNATRKELQETKKEFGSTKREIARFRKAVEKANNCDYHDTCPVLHKLRDFPKDGNHDTVGFVSEHRGQYPVRSDRETDGDSTDVIGDTEDSGGQPDATTFQG